MTLSVPSTASKLRAKAHKPSRSPHQKGDTAEPASIHSAILAEARRTGLLDGEKSEHVSFRVPLALLDAAKRETGIASTSELGMLAFALVAQSDPIAAFFRRTRGRLGKDHTLDV